LIIYRLTIRRLYQLGISANMIIIDFL